MANALTMFDDPKKSKLPAHLKGFLDEEGGNIQDRGSVPSLTFEGKVWTIALNGDKKKMTKVDEDGDEIPVSVITVVVLAFNPRRGRAFYAGDYDPKAVKQPDCWSADGIAPHDSVKEKQASKCDGCPMSIKGSKVSANGKAVTACSQHRMVVVVPANDLSHPPLRMKIPVTSDWDKNSPDWEAQGYYAFNNYTDFLRSKGVTHTAILKTKIRFDPDAAYPKLLFTPAGWLDDTQLELVKPIVKSDEVKKLLSDEYTPAGADGVPTKADAAEPAPKAAQKPAKAVALDDDEDEAPKPKPKKAPVTLDGDDDDVKARPIKAEAGEKFIKPRVLDEDEDEAPKPKKAKARVLDEDEDEAPAPKKKAARVIDDEDEERPAPKAGKKPARTLDDDEDGETAVAAKPQKPAKATATAPSKVAAATTAVPEDVSSILSDWGDDD